MTDEQRIEGAAEIIANLRDALADAEARIEEQADVIRKYHVWLEQVELLRVCPDCGRRGYIGLDHRVGENNDGCDGCAALTGEADDE